MTTPTIHSDFNSFYLVQDLQGLDTYERSKAIQRFISKGTKLLEMYLDSEIEKIFSNNAISIADNEKETITGAFNDLKRKGKQVEITDLFSGKKFYRCKYITTTKSKMTIVLEDDRYLQAGVRIEVEEV